jgi:hypothetical protein
LFSKLFTHFAVLTPIAFALVACSSDSDPDVDVTPSETRADRISELADSVCARYADTSAGCPGYGTGSDQKYQTEGDCERDYENKAGELWPADKCDDGRINSGKFDVCKDRAKAVACSGNVWDAVAALAECNASAVCTDPAD